MRELKYIILSIIAHAAFIGGFAVDWNFREKPQYFNTEVLLMGERTGDKIAPKPEKVTKKEKTQKVVENDPEALKTYDKEAPDLSAQENQGSFGQGGKVELDYNTELKAWIQANKKYPKLARRLGQECETVTVEYKIHPDGHIDNITLKEKCQYDILNQAAVEMIKASSPFKPFPESFPKTAITKVQSVEYKLVD